METNKIENVMSYFILGSLTVLALGLFMSISFMALSHVLIFFPLVYFFKDIQWNKLKIHNWGLIIFSILIPISIFYARNMEHSLHLFNIMKFKYYLIGALSATPISWWLKNRATKKQIRFLIHTLFITASVASIVGYISWKIKYNPLKMGVPNNDYQNSGMFGISLTYSYSETVLCTLMIGCLIYYKEISEYLNKKILIINLIINLFGLYTSYSRGALITLVIATPFFFFKKNKKYFLLTLIVFILSFIAARFIVPDLDRIFSGRQHSNLLREGQWLAAIKLIELNPLMGVGFRNFQPWSTVIKTQYGYPEPLWEGHAHNNYLEIFSGMGIIGFIPFMVWLFGWLIDSYKREDIFGKICFPTVIVIILGGLTQNTITDGCNVFFFMIVYSLYNIKQIMD